MCSAIYQKGFETVSYGFNVDKSACRITSVAIVISVIVDESFGLFGILVYGENENLTKKRIFSVKQRNIFIWISSTAQARMKTWADYTSCFINDYLIFYSQSHTIHVI